MSFDVFQVNLWAVLVSGVAYFVRVDGLSHQGGPQERALVVRPRLQGVRVEQAVVPAVEGVPRLTERYLGSSGVLERRPGAGRCRGDALNVPSHTPCPPGSPVQAARL
jgi:hypothetical protein